MQKEQGSRVGEEYDECKEWAARKERIPKWSPVIHWATALQKNYFWSPITGDHPERKGWRQTSDFNSAIFWGKNRLID